MPQPKTAKNIYQRLLAIMQDVSFVKKEDKKVNGQYSYVSHDAVTAAIRPALVKHGVLCVPTIASTERDGNLTTVHVHVQFVNVDEPEQVVTVDSFGYGADNQDKGPGKAMSYAFKYAILKAFCLETGDIDPEAQMITATPATKAQQGKPGKVERTKVDSELARSMGLRQ